MKLLRFFLITLVVSLFTLTSSFAATDTDGDQECAVEGLNFQHAMKMAKENNAHSKFHLCYMYLKGCGVSKSTNHAVKWCEEASENGVWEASIYLAGLYQHTGSHHVSDIPKDYKKAAHYYELFMKQHPNGESAYNMLAWLYENGGYGLEKNIEKANHYKKLHIQKMGDK